jgi:YidC/Oxa1 family membrane protein insertase
MLVNAIFEVLKAIYGFVGDWGLAIIVLTALFRLLLWPLTIKQTRSMANMQKVQPLMKEIQEKYADDKEKQNAEMMKLYSEYKINPLSGCLPMLIQMPLLIAFYSVLAAPTVSTKTHLITRVGPLAKYLGFQVGEKFLASEKVGSFLGILPDIMLSPKAAMAQGFVQAIPYLIVLVIFGVSIILPTLMMPQTNSADAQARQQKTMSYGMAAMMLFVGYSIPAGALLYYDVSSLLAVGQQFLTQRAMKAEAVAEEKEIIIESGKSKGNKGKDRNNG